MRIQLPSGGIVLGLGIDIIEVERVRGVHQRFGDRFVARILTAEERDYCLSMNNPYPHMAARFAAKEAISKAFTTGIGRYLKWTSISVYNGERMEPLVRLDAQAKALLKEVGGTSVLISLSHTNVYANAVAAVVRGGQSIDGV